MTPSYSSLSCFLCLLSLFHVVCCYDTIIEGEARPFQFEGTNVTSTLFRNVTFLNTPNEYTIFSGISLKDVMFHHVTFTSRADCCDDEVFASDLSFENALFTNVTFLEVTFDASLHVHFWRSTMNKVVFQTTTFNGATEFEDVLVTELSLIDVYAGPDRSGSVDDGYFLLNRTFIDDMGIESSDFRWNIGFFGSEISRFSSFGSSYTSFHCGTDQVYQQDASLFYHSNFYNSTFNDHFNCPSSTWNDLRIHDNVVFRADFNMSHATLDMFFLKVLGSSSQGNMNMNRWLDFSNSVLDNGILDYIEGFTLADFSGSQLGNNVMVNSVVGPAKFENMVFSSNLTDSFNRTCCDQFCRLNRCECLISEGVPFAVCVNATETPTVSVTPSTSLSPTASITATTSISASQTQSPSVSIISPSETPSESLSVTNDPIASASDQLGTSNSIQPTPSVSTTVVVGTTRTACFPAESTVRLLDGQNVPMKELSYFSTVAVGSSEFSDVFFFGHRHVSAEASYLEFEHTGQHSKLRISPGHYIYVNGRLATARSIVPGDQLRNENGKDVVEVTAVNVVQATGMYAPTTMKGELVVDGVVVSSYTDAVHPHVAHRLLAPLRVLYTAGLKGIVSQFKMFESTSWDNVARTIGLQTGDERY